MNRKERIHMLSCVLLMPFALPGFEREDPLLARTKVYLRLRDKGADYGKLRGSYDRAQGELLNKLRDFAGCDSLDELAQTVKMFYPEAVLADCLEERGSLQSCYLEMLLQIAGEFITLRDGRLSIRMWMDAKKDRLFSNQSGLYKVEIWSELCRIITPDILIAGYFVQSGIRDTRYLFHLPGTICLSDSLVDRYLQKGIAETHLHFSAAMDYLSVWEYNTNLMIQAKQADKSAVRDSELRALSLLRLMLAYFLENGRGEDIEAFYANMPFEARLTDALLYQKDVPAAEDELQALCGHVQSFYLCEGERPSSFDLLLQGPYRRYEELRTSSEILLLFQCLWYTLDSPGDKAFGEIFLQYLRLKHAYFAKRVQPVKLGGLTEFRRYFREGAGSLKRQSDSAAWAAFCHQCQSPYLKKLEIRISLPNYFMKHLAIDMDMPRLEGKKAIAVQLKGLLTSFLRVYEEFPEENWPSLGVTYHFRKQDVSHLPMEACWFSRREDFRDTNYVEVLRARGIWFLRCLQELFLEVPYLCEYVVGIDAASEENYTEPWVFAPVYRSARNRSVTYPVHRQTQRPMQNIGFTYHVGEEYRHVLSGFRHIDEVLTHFGYHAGDRLGHGLVLQIDLQKWLGNNEVISLPIIEHLENLLWLWKLCGEGIASLNVHELGLEQEIMKLAEEIYGTGIQGLSPHMLWEAYEQKFAPLDEGLYQRVHTVCPLACLFGMEADTPFEDGFVWNTEKLLLTHYCPAFVRKYYQKPILVHTPMERLTLYQEIQKHIREKVGNAGIFVETNPTSNMLIGDVESLFEYPVTTLNSKPMSMDASLLLSVNSDDPLTFNTNTENELAIVYHMLLGRGYSAEDVLAWIDKVRAYGMKSSFIRTVKEPQQQREELTAIIRRLNDYTME